MEKIKASLRGATAYFSNSKWSSTLGSFENYFWKFKMPKGETLKTFKLSFIGFEKAKVFGSQRLSLNTLGTEKYPDFQTKLHEALVLNMLVFSLYPLD